MQAKRFDKRFWRDLISHNQARYLIAPIHEVFLCYNSMQDVSHTRAFFSSWNRQNHVAHGTKDNFEMVKVTSRSARCAS